MNDWTAFAFETITIASASGVTRLSSTAYNASTGGLPARKALIYVDAGPNIRFTLNGTTVNTGTGHNITAFMYQEIYGHENIKNFQATSTKEGTAGQITATYFR